MNKIKIILFGGTFDPIHLGHTMVASYAADVICADKVIFIPAKKSPLKPNSPFAGDTHRINMLDAAVKCDKRFEVSDCEIKKDDPSYTIETVRYFRTKLGKDAVLHWLIGSDNINDLPRWYKIKELIDECNLCIMYRGGCDKPDLSRFANIWGIERVDKLTRNIIQTPLIDISSTQIRKQLSQSLDVSNMLDGEVVEYIKANRLYT